MALDHVTHARLDDDGRPACQPFGYPMPKRPSPGFPHRLAGKDEAPTCNRCQIALTKKQPRTKRKLHRKAVAVPARPVRSTRRERQSDHKKRMIERRVHQLRRQPGWL